MSRQGADTKLNLSRQLRPIRLAFLVPAGDANALRTAVEANTCLWGGMQNPIIPIHTRRPKAWGDPWEWPGSIAYAKGVLYGFEPDFIVETKPGLARGLGADDRVIAMKDVISVP